ncbi:MAG: hypothetical protein ACTSUE_15410 [Promethearchaeota archaeon]
MNSCPHGFFAASECPECSMKGNVKPLLPLDDKKFFEFSVNRERELPDGVEPPRTVASDKILDVSNLRPGRLLPDEKLRIQLPSPSNHLNSRIRQIRGNAGTMTSIDMRDKVEKRLKQIRTHSLNPFVKDED